MTIFFAWLYEWLNGVSYPFLILSGLSCVILFKVRSAQLKAQVPDSLYSYSEIDLEDFFQSVGKKGVRLYQWTQLTLDIIFPLTYGCWLAKTIKWIYPESWVSYLLITTALAASIADIAENILLVGLAQHFLKRPLSKVSSNVQLAMKLTRAKFVLIALSVLSLPLGVIAMDLSYLCPLRYPILFGLLIILFPLVANVTPAKSLLKNLFALDSFWQIGSVIFGAIMASFMVAFELQQFLLDKLKIFQLSLPFYSLEIVNDSSLDILTFLGVLPTLFFVVLESRKVKHEIVSVLGGSALGIAFGTGLIRVIFFLRSALKDANLQTIFPFNIFADIRQFITDYPQYFALGLSLWLVGLVVYAATLFIYKPRLPEDRLFKLEVLHNAPALLYVYLLTWVWSGLLGFLSFFLDQYHYPVFLSLFAFSALMYFALDVDHFYQVSPTTQPDPTFADASNFKKSLEARRQKIECASTTKPLVVIAASGGGIQAAAWTAKVLCGLQVKLGVNFTQSIAFISSVSGGSVGVMNFIDQCDPSLGHPPQENLSKIFQNSCQDNLDAVGWGLAGPDLARFLGLPLLAFGKYNDRGAAIEDDWRTNMINQGSYHLPHAKPYSLMTWRSQIQKGGIPIPVFNATLVEDGRRYLISPMTFFKTTDEADQSKAFDFNTLFNNSENRIPKNDKVGEPPTIIYDMDVTTAARLSASFPYVSPVARNNGQFKYNYHVTDGGYFDNSGMVTAIEWLNNRRSDQESTLKELMELNVKDIILVQINAFPDANLTAQKGDKGFIMEWVGPLQAVYTVRDSTLKARNTEEINLLKEKFSASGIKVHSYEFTFPSGYDQPLSWKLTQEQINNLEKAWEEVHNPNAHSQSQDLRENFTKLEEVWTQLGC
jgi:hypothetical protein